MGSMSRSKMADEEECTDVGDEGIEDAREPVIREFAEGRVESGWGVVERFGTPGVRWVVVRPGVVAAGGEESVIAGLETMCLSWATEDMLSMSYASSCMCVKTKAPN